VIEEALAPWGAVVPKKKKEKKKRILLVRLNDSRIH
jgi:hypothetical protein